MNLDADVANPRKAPAHFLNMIEPQNHDAVCKEIAGELEDMARWLSGGELSPEQFRLNLARLEAQKLKRFGLKLRSLVSEDGMVHFTLRFAETHELCASMDVDPITGKLCTQLGCP